MSALINRSKPNFGMASFDNRNETQVRPKVIAAALASGSHVVAGEIDTRALWVEKRELQAKIDVFFSTLKTDQFANDIDATEKTTKTFHGYIDNLKGVIIMSSQTLELNIISSLSHMYESLNCAYKQWQESLANTPLSIPIPPASDLEIEDELADAPPVVKPCDFVSNCSTGTEISSTTVASSQLRLQQIELE